MSANFTTARAFMSAGNFPAARKLIDEILHAEPENPTAHALLVDLELKCGHVSEARRLCERCLGRWPDHPDIRMNHILTQIPRKPWLIWCWKVRQMIKRWAHDFPDRRHEALFLEAIWALRSNWPGRARRLREQIAEIAPGSIMLNILDRMTAQVLGDPLLREGAARDGLAINAADAKAHAELAHAQFEQCRFFAARRSAKAALAADPTNRKPAQFLILTWLMLIPPFFFKHAFFCIPDILRRHVRSRTARFAMWIGLFILALKINLGWIDLRIFIAFVVLFLSWEFVRGAVATRYRGKAQPKNIKLARY